MAGVDDGVRSASLASFCRLVVHVFGVAAGKVGAAATVEEQGVAADESAVDVEALAARCVAGSVDQA